MNDAAQVIAQVPTNFYVIVGGLVLANLGTMVTIFYGIGKLVWFIAKLDSRVSSLENDMSKDIDAAHEAIRDLKRSVGAM
jgi:hypothetical protein